MRLHAFDRVFLSLHGRHRPSIDFCHADGTVLEAAPPVVAAEWERRRGAPA